MCSPNTEVFPSKPEVSVEGLNLLIRSEKVWGSSYFKGHGFPLGDFILCLSLKGQVSTITHLQQDFSSMAVVLREYFKSEFWRIKFPLPSLPPFLTPEGSLVIFKDYCKISLKSN